MGNLNVTKLSSKEDKAIYINQLTKDIEALEIMIQNGMIEKSPIRIGAEQEFCIVDDEFLPNSNSLDILNDINDSHFTSEIGNFNLEINLDPLELKDDCFSKLHDQLLFLLEKAKVATSKRDSKIILTGILHTLSLKNISVNNMAKIQRYYVLDEAIRESRKQDFAIHIKGVDELNLLHDSVMLEACNTSFQMHLQVNPDAFIETYNWAQAISGPILSVCANSPLLFGKELWSETRIALFTQSVDTRANSFLLNEKQSRVSFGNAWETSSITNIFKDNVSRFRSLITAENFNNSQDVLQKGKIPKLKALCLHNGTVYRWNRACYGVGNDKPHLRIENRYIPSGPTTIDEVANMVFWIGIMLGKPKQYNNIHEKWDFKDVKSNFFSAARYGMATQFYWNNKYISSHKLILNELLPLAYKGLYKAGIVEKDIEKYLTIIENRVKSYNGSQWIIRSYRNLLKSQKPFEASQNLTSKMYLKQENNFPVGTWRILNKNAKGFTKANITVKHKMNRTIFSVDKNDSLELVLNIMKWKNIHHVPVINSYIQIIGLLSWSDVKIYMDKNKKRIKSVQDIMKKKVITITQEKSIEDAKKVMKKHKINCLPVVKQKKLIGIITSNDF